MKNKQGSEGTAVPYHRRTNLSSPGVSRHDLGKNQRNPCLLSVATVNRGAKEFNL